MPASAQAPITAGRAPRRELLLAVLGCALIAGFLLFAASRTWEVVATERVAPLPPLAIRRTGASVAPAIPALALVALAGAGALVAARGRGRILTGVLVGSAGLGVAGAALAALRTGLPAAWPSCCLAGGLVLAAAGAVAAARGQRWPVMGARYEPGVGAPAPGMTAGGGPEPGRATGHRSGPTDGSGDARHTALWAAIDRGEDPTKE
jgi:Tryptophan-associated transmembrane protein (Trp_oprn_chp)